MTARGRSLDENLVDEFVKWMQGGSSFANAARLSRVPKRTAYYWRAKGEQDELFLRDTLHARFFREVEAVRGQLVGKIEHLSHAVVDGAIRCPDCRRAHKLDLAGKDVMHHVRFLQQTLARETYGDNFDDRLREALEQTFAELEPYLKPSEFRALCGAVVQAHEAGRVRVVPQVAGLLAAENPVGD